MLRVVGCLWILLFAACETAMVGKGARVELPRDSTPQCGELCAQIGLPLDSVVIIANNVGCVCRAPVPAPAGSPPGAAASAGATAMIMLAAQTNRDHHSSTPPPTQPTR